MLFVLLTGLSYRKLRRGALDVFALSIVLTGRPVRHGNISDTVCHLLAVGSMKAKAAVYLDRIGEELTVRTEFGIFASPRQTGFCLSRDDGEPDGQRKG